MRWAITYVVLLLLVVIALAFLIHQARSVEPWDGTFQCRPGETYTTKECP